jgi:ubiquinone/menaquinone biosynthesis C-methylase UbiE
MRHRGIKARKRGISREVAASLGAPAELAPVLGELVSRLSSLGAMPGEVVRLLREAGVGRGASVLELGCGKGSVAVAIAGGLRCRVRAVDGCEPFIEVAKMAASRAKVQRLCRFELGDVKEYEGGRGRFDAAVMLNLYPCERAARVLREWVKPGGIYVVDDAFRSRPARGHLGTLPTKEDCRQAIERLGDEIENEFVPVPSRVRAMSGRRIAKVKIACEVVGRGHPDLKGALAMYMSDLAASGRLLGGAVRPAVWVVRRRSTRAE